MIKLFVSDIDGTLLNEKHELAPETQAAIHKLREAGVSFMVASGRNYEAIQVAIAQMNINIKCIALNGGDYRDNQGKSIITHPIEEEAVDAMYAIIQQSDATLEYYCENGSYTQIEQDKLIDVYTENFMCIFDTTYAKARAFVEGMALKEYMITEKDFAKIKANKILKLEFHFRNLSEKNRINNLLKDVKGIHLTSSAPLNIEITHHKATKGNMIEEVCDYYGYQKEEVVVIGDSANDISMLTRFPNSYAMGNAPQAIKDVATHVAKDNAHNGVAHVIEQIIQNNK